VIVLLLHETDRQVSEAQHAYLNRMVYPRRRPPRQ
jgi:hypothetical protein